MTVYQSGISVVLVAHNEERRLPKWFKNVTWADECIVVDSGSTDRTAEISRKYTDKIFSVPNRLNFHLNKSFGMEQATHEWILVLDADEFPTEELVESILSVTRDTECPHVGYKMLRREFILGQELHSPQYHLRMCRNGKGRHEGPTVHHGIEVAGSVGTLHGEILHYTDDSIFERVHKSNWYSEGIAAHWYEAQKSFRLIELLLRPLYLFILTYFVQGWFKRGMLGFITAINVTYSEFLRYAKLWSAYEQGHFPSPSDEYPPRFEDGVDRIDQSDYRLPSDR